jgi:CDGSH-type Zn-finger protein
MSDAPKIECVPNGPLRVHGLTSLRNSKGAVLPTKDVTVLCRCGGSSKKPYCDGTHRSNGFSSAKLDDRGIDRLDSYAGKRITIHDNRSVCAHAGRCTDGLPKTFRSDMEPFVDPNVDAVERIIETVNRCPSGALSYSIEALADDPQQVAPTAEPAILVTPGPYAVTGNIAIDQPMNRGASPHRFTLCRCGGSKNKPYCDGTHWAIQFKDDSN